MVNSLLKPMIDWLLAVVGGVALLAVCVGVTAFVMALIYKMEGG